MRNSKEIGNLTELQCITRLYELGYSVSVPFGNANKYDLIIDVDDKLYKVQVKHGLEHIDTLGEVDYIKIRCTWQSHNYYGYSLKRYSENEIDFFATFYDGECYMIPIAECSTVKILHIKPPASGQRKGVSFIEDYKAQDIISKL